MKLKVLSKLLVSACIMFLCFGGAVQAAETYDVPSGSSFKSYMDYRTITSRRSKQYAIQSQSITDENGLRRYKGYYTIAIGTGFGASAGDYVDVQLANDTLLHCIVGDIKRNEDTGADNIQVSHNGNVVEFIVDTSALDPDIRTAGDIAGIPGFEGDVKTVTVLGTANLDVNAVEVVEETPTVLSADNRSTYLIVGMYEIPVPNGKSLYSVEYAFGDIFDNIICTEEFYNSVSVGDIVETLE